MELTNYFVAVSFHGNGSLGFNIKTGSEEMAKLIVLQDYLLPDFKSLMEDIIVVPQYRIDCLNKKEG